ncbi:MAG: hypothetical protein H9949_03255 [Candidatus Phocaeicola merdigallinarum]|nr:hypothetical protein [Candidatus Phocaeicola merdigallinarum]
MCFNIEEHIYGLIIVTLILIILIGCSIYFHKKKNISSNTILSIWSISLSAIAIIVTMVRVDVYFTNDSFVGIMAGFMGACATILVGVQIYNSIETSRKIKNIDYLQTKIGKDIDFLKNEKERIEHYINYRTLISLGVATIKERPIFALKKYLSALKEALYLNDAQCINRVLLNIENFCNRSKNTNPFTISKDSFDANSYPPEKLQKFQSYPLIEKRYKTCYNNIIKLQKECQEQSETAS